jgi:hypothetical protein
MPRPRSKRILNKSIGYPHLLLDFVFILIRITLHSSKRTREWEQSDCRESSTVASARGKEIKKIHPSANCRIERIMGFAVEAWSVRFLVHIPQTPKLRNCANWWWFQSNEPVFSSAIPTFRQFPRNFGKRGHERSNKPEKWVRKRKIP